MVGLLGPVLSPPSFRPPPYHYSDVCIYKYTRLPALHSGDPHRVALRGYASQDRIALNHSGIKDQPVA